MATTTELMALGLPPLLANKLSDSDIYVPDSDGGSALGSASAGFSEVHISDGSGRGSFDIIGSGGSAMIGVAGSLGFRNAASISYRNAADSAMLTGISFTASDTMQTGNPWVFGSTCTLYSRTDANRGAAGNAGNIIFNTDDG